MIGIYKITSPTGKVYIGSSTNIEKRWTQYKSMCCGSQTKLYNSFKKHGVSSHTFEIVVECVSADLNKLEYYYGHFFNVLDSKVGLNCRLPKSEDMHVCMSNETKGKISKANKGKGLGKKLPFYNSSLKLLTKERVVSIKKELIENKTTQAEIAEKYGVARKVISDISSGKYYKSVGENINLGKRKKQYHKLEQKDYDEIKRLRKCGESYRSIARKYNVDYAHVYRIVTENKHKKERIRSSRCFCHQKQNKIRAFIKKITAVVQYNNSQEVDKFGNSLGKGYKPEVIERLKETIALLEKVIIMIDYADWLISGEYNEETYVQKMKAYLLTDGEEA